MRKEGNSNGGIIDGGDWLGRDHRKARQSGSRELAKEIIGGWRGCGVEGTKATE
jgi:hypothetical protein